MADLIRTETDVWVFQSDGKPAAAGHPNAIWRRRGVPGLHVPHCPELIPAGADQRRHHPPLGDGFGGVATVPEGVAVVRLAAAALSAAVHPAPRLPAHCWLPAWRPPPGPGMASGRLVQ